MTTLAIPANIAGDVANALRDAAWNIARQIAVNKVDSASGSIYFVPLPEGERNAMKCRIEELMMAYGQLTGTVQYDIVPAMIAQIEANIILDDERAEEADKEKERASAAMHAAEAGTNAYDDLVAAYWAASQARERAVAVANAHRRA